MRSRLQQPFPGASYAQQRTTYPKWSQLANATPSSWLNSQNMTDSKEAVPRPGGRFQPEMEIIAINF